MNRRQITLVPTAGLCNRLNAILCAIRLQEELDWDITILWDKNKDCYAQFNDLFEPIEGIKVLPLENYRYKPATLRNLFIPYILRCREFDLCLDGSKSTFKDITPILSQASNIYIHSYNRFSTQDITSSLGRYFVPEKTLAAQIDEVVSRYNDVTYGLHIRRTDNMESIKLSPIERFISFIENKLSVNPESRFYLATDDNMVKSDLVKRFGDHIIIREATLNRDSVEGMKDAVVDLFCLARTSMIFGSGCSTYSLTAANLYNKELIV